MIRAASAIASFAITLAITVLVAGCAGFHPAVLPGTPAEATFVDVDGVHVHYREAGRGPAVILIHGFGASLDSWAGVIPELATSHRVIAIDLKGFGWTSRPAGDYSPEAEAGLAWHVLDKLDVADVAIVGHSWGSSVALSMAVAQPDRVRQVALYDAFVYDEQVPSFLAWAQRGGIGELLFGAFYRERIEDRVPLAYADDRFVTQARIDHAQAELDRPGTTAAALAVARGMHFAALHAKLAGFVKPVLLLWGEDDVVTPLKFGRRLAEELANARLATFAHCGHLPMVEARRTSTRELVGFLADPAAGSASAAGSGSAPAAGSAAGSAAAPAAAPAAGSAAAPAAAAGSAAAAAAGSNSGSNSGSAPAAASNSGSASTAPYSADSAADSAAAESIFAAPATAPTTAAGSTPTPAPALPLGADLASIGSELAPRAFAASRDRVELDVHGQLRVRGAYLYNLDLDRGLDASGKPLFPVPLGGGQALESDDLRARTDISIYAPGVGVAVHSRIDWLDNVALGGSPDLAGGSPATSGGQNPSEVVVKRAWAEALTPAGTLAVGRMGAHFGLGIAANGGDCEDCDHGDAADRLAFVTPIAGHLIAIAYDIASSGPFTQSKDGGRYIALDPSDKVAGPTLAIFKVHTPAALARRTASGLTSVEYAGYISHRTQQNDVPASYLGIAQPTTFTSEDLVDRGFEATATGAWLRVSSARFRVEAELAYINASVAQPSLVPGAVITEPVTSSQLGLAIESDLVVGGGKLGLDGGYASGDPAPGFGAFPAAGATAAPPGSLDGPQANPPGDRTVDNFRFHPDYHIDQILFREIIGTVTDAIYIRPHARTTLLTAGAGRLEAGAALIASWAVDATSTPSGSRALGVELDPELRYASRDGFAATIDYGVLLPGAAFDNPVAHLDAKPAQVIRARLAFAF